MSSVEQIKPLGDFVLVQRLPDEDTQRGIVIPEAARNPREGVRRGLVIAIGAGDRLFGMVCQTCHLAAWKALRQKFIHSAERIGWQLSSTCPHCGGKLVGTGDETRAEMNVQPGNVILYHRAPANDIRMSGAEYVLLHEEQHILAVLE